MSNHLALPCPPYIFRPKINPKVAISVDYAVQCTTRKSSLADLLYTFPNCRLWQANIENLDPPKSGG